MNQNINSRVNFLIKKVSLVFLVIIFIIFFVSGCFLSAEQQQVKKEVSNTAKQLAIEYLRDKYNMSKPEVTDVYVSTGSIWTGYDYTDCAKVYFKYNNEEFKVQVDTSTNFIRDDYQCNEIREDFIEYVESYFEDNFILSKESVKLEDIHGNRSFMLDDSEYYDASTDDLMGFISDISFGFFIKYDGSKNFYNDIKKPINNFINTVNINETDLDIQLGIYKENKIISQEEDNMVKSIYTYDFISNPLNLYKALIWKTDDHDLITEEFNYEKYIKFRDGLEIPEYKLNGEIVDVETLHFYNKESDEHFIEPDFSEADKSNYEIIYDFFKYSCWGSPDGPNFIWFKYDISNLPEESIDKLAVIKYDIKPIKFTRLDNSIYFRVQEDYEYAIVIKNYK